MSSEAILECVESGFKKYKSDFAFQEKGKKEQLGFLYDMCRQRKDFIDMGLCGYRAMRYISNQLALYPKSLTEDNQYFQKALSVLKTDFVDIKIVNDAMVSSSVQPGGFRVEPMKSLAESATSGKKDSSNIDKVGYFNSMLEVEFNSGQRYIYFVGPDFYDRFNAAPSKGKFLWTELRGKEPGVVWPGTDPSNRTPGGMGGSIVPYARGTAGTPDEEAPTIPTPGRTMERQEQFEGKEREITSKLLKAHFQALKFPKSGTPPTARAKPTKTKTSVKPSEAAAARRGGDFKTHIYDFTINTKIVDDYPVAGYTTKAGIKKTAHKRGEGKKDSRLKVGQIVYFYGAGGDRIKGRTSAPWDLQRLGESGHWDDEKGEYVKGYDDAAAPNGSYLIQYTNEIGEYHTLSLERSKIYLSPPSPAGFESKFKLKDEIKQWNTMDYIVDDSFADLIAWVQAHIASDPDAAKEIAFRILQKQRSEGKTEKTKKTEKSEETKEQKWQKNWGWLSIHFENLGLKKENITVNDIKLAFFKTAKKTHPDRKGGDPKKFMAAHKSYKRLLREIIPDFDDSNKEGRWITIKGKHIFLKKGERLSWGKDGAYKKTTESKAEAIKRKIEEKGLKKESVETEAQKKERETQAKTEKKEEGKEAKRRQGIDRMAKGAKGEKAPEAREAEIQKSIEQTGISRENAEKEYDEKHPKKEIPPEKKKLTQGDKHKISRKKEAIESRIEKIKEINKGKPGGEILAEFVNVAIKMIEESEKDGNVILPVAEYISKVHKDAKLSEQRKTMLIKQMKKFKDEIRSIKSDMFGTTLYGPLGRGGEFAYEDKEGNPIVKVKDYKQLKELLQNTEHAPAYGSKSIKGHNESYNNLIGFTYGPYEFNDSTEQIFGHIETFEPIHNLSDLKHPEDLEVSFSWYDASEDSDKYQDLVGIRSIDVSLNNDAVGRCRTRNGLACTVSPKEENSQSPVHNIDTDNLNKKSGVRDTNDHHTAGVESELFEPDIKKKKHERLDLMPNELKKKELKAIDDMIKFMDDSGSIADGEVEGRTSKDIWMKECQNRGLSPKVCQVGFDKFSLKQGEGEGDVEDLDKDAYNGEKTPGKEVKKKGQKAGISGDMADKAVPPSVDIKALTAELTKVITQQVKEDFSTEKELDAIKKRLIERGISEDFLAEKDLKFLKDFEAGLPKQKEPSPDEISDFNTGKLMEYKGATDDFKSELTVIRSNARKEFGMEE